MSNTSQSWKDVKIQDITENLDNKRVPVTKSDRKVGDVPYYGATGIVDYVDDYIFDEKLLLIGEDGADWSPYANSAFIIDGKSWVNNHAHVLRVTGADIDFLKEYLNFSDLRLHVSGTTRGKLNKSDLMNIQIPLPSIQTQQKISNILMVVNNEIEKTDQIIQKTEELKSGLMNGLLTKGIGHKKLKKTKLGEIPEEWDVVSLQDLIDTGFIKSHLDSNHGELYPKSSEFTEEGIPYISANNLKGNRVDFKGSKYLSVSRAKQFKKGVALDGDVLFAHNATVGPVAMPKTNYSFVILSTSLTYYRCDISKLDPEYLMNYMQSEIFKAQYQRIMSQTTRNQVPITAQRVLLHVIPPMNEQTEIAKILSSVDAKISKNNSEKAELNKLKNGLMHDIFNQKVQIN